MNTFRLLSALLIILTEKQMETKAFRVLDVNGEETILALENENISIECKKDMPMAYCGFRHPSGKRLSFSGMDLNDGRCAVNIKATVNDTGEWRCHIGRKTTGMEIMQKKQVRVVNQLAALQPNITAGHNDEVTLSCITTKGFVTLSYCRFEPPKGNPFNINGDVNISNAILGRYYYPKNKSLDRGDCCVTIHNVKYSDVGLWTCGAGFDDGQEYTDNIQLNVQGVYTMSTASATNITLSAIAIAAFLGFLGFIAWRNRRFLGTANRERPAVAEPEHEMHAMEQQLHPSNPQVTPQGSPRIGSVPRVVVDSPSTPSNSPLMP